MSSNVEEYRKRFLSSRPKSGPGSHPLTKQEIKESGASIHQHRPLDEIFGHPVSEGEIQAFNSDTSNTGYTLPFKKYEGPGNSVNRGDPEDSADAVAQEHDLKYFDAQYRYNVGEISKAEAEREIEDSDVSAIKDFYNVGGIGGTFGAIGLGTKHLVEKVTGQIYPSLGKPNKLPSISGKMSAKKTIISSYKGWWDQQTKDYQDQIMNDPHAGYMFSTDSADIEDTIGGKRGASGTGGGPVNKKQAFQAEADSSLSSSAGNTSSFQSPSTQASSSVVSSTVPEDIEMGLPGTAKGGGGSGDGNANSSMMIYEPERPLSLFGKKISTYRKVHRFMTFGIAPAWISINLTTPTENQRWLTTALANIPWELPIMYLNPSEFALIPNGSYVKEVRIRIVHRGNRIAFETGEVATRLATLNQIQNVMVGFGLNKTGWGTNSTYPSFDPTNPMVPTAITAPIYSTFDENFYGLANADPNLTTVIPTHQLGIPFPLPNYFCLANATQNFGGVPPLTENVQFADGKTTIDQTVATFNYKPKMSPLKVPLKHIRSGLPYVGAGTAALVVHTNGAVENTFNASITATQDGTGAVQANNQVANAIQNNWTSGQFTIIDNIEKSQYVKQGPWGQYQRMQVQPSVHVGVQAIPSLTSTGILSPIANWTDCQADWDVFCEMDVVEHTPTKLPYATQANVPAGDVIYRTQQVFPDSDACTYAGLYPNNSIRS